MTATTYQVAVKSMTVSFDWRAALLNTESISESEGVKISPPRRLLDTVFKVFKLTPKTFLPGQLVCGVSVPYTCEKMENSEKRVKKRAMVTNFVSWHSQLKIKGLV